VGQPVAVTSTDPASFVFEGAINDFPSPDVEKDNVNYLAGIREIGVRSEFTDGRDLPRLALHSIQFEGPYYEQWPPESHRRIFIETQNKSRPEEYAREILQSFMNRAYRRLVDPEEVSLIHRAWQESFEETRDFQQSVKAALLVVLTSPQFLFLIESSQSPEPEDLGSYELASKLAYFLWNSPPDRVLLESAQSETIHRTLDEQAGRMMSDSRFKRFVSEFTSQWLSLDKFDVVEVDHNRFPMLTRTMKGQLRQEPIEFLAYLIENNLPLRNLIQSDFVLVNDPVARYYDLGGQVETGLRYQPLPHQSPHLGGVLTAASLLAGLSDGRESNPVKRGAWIARKIVAEPPDDPPPNVPELKEEEGQNLTLREKLERHRNQEGCIKCHSGIDPWGVPFETFDAAGRFKSGKEVDARSTLPDGTDVSDLNGLKAYLVNDRIDQVAFSVLKHLSCYAVGRSLTYNEIEFLREEALKLRSSDYRLKDMILFVLHTDIF
ncbi:MAG: DUF1592 domain-containing protein, partial [Planctomycetes bacterium]|nr:DUF1592 domain-containing protein [Planctomycetota bacterium]